MSHEISITNDGIAEAYYANVPAWHGLGSVVQGARTSKEAIRLAHLDWDVEALPLFTQAPTMTPDGVVYQDGAHGTVKLDSHVALVRTDTGAVLGVSGSDYGIVLNREAFGALDRLAQDGQVFYESAMALRGGRLVVLLARLPGVDQVTAKDAVHRYVMLVTSHDGTRALQIIPTAVRVVCANTWRAAIGRGGDVALSFRHTSGIKQNVAAGISAVRAANEMFDRDFAMAKRLVERQLRAEEWLSILDTLIPVPDKQAAPRAWQNATTARSDLDLLYRTEPTCNLDGIGGTAWAAFNAVTHYVDHGARFRGRPGSFGGTPQEAAFYSRSFGVGNDMKVRAKNAFSALVPVEAGR